MAIYYVDATGGNDGDTGLSPANAWQTIGKVNGEAFNAGDSILFKRGETWVGTTLLVPSSGAAGNPITFADYNTGNKPIIDGNDVANCVDANGQDYIGFENLECTQGLNFGILCSGVTGITVTDCDCHDCGNDNLVFISVCVDCHVYRGTFYAAYNRAGGQICGIEIADGSHDIAVLGVESYSNVDAGVGISIHSHIGLPMPYNIAVRNCYFHDNAAHGIFVFKSDNAADTGNIIISDCAAIDNLDRGISIQRVAPATAYPSDITVRRCIVRGNANKQVRCFESDDLTFENNIFDSLAVAQIAVDILGCVGVTFSSNTFYTTHNTTAGILLALQSARLANFVFKNNCFYADNATAYMILHSGGAGVAGVDIDYNFYRDNGGGACFKWNGGGGRSFASWQLASGQDANSNRGDPLFVDVINFYLQRGSPSLQVGTPLAGYPFYGVAPDCGRWEMRWKSIETEQRLQPAWKEA